MVFLGYESGTKGYRVFDPVNNQLHVIRDVVFEEKENWNWNSSVETDQAVTDIFTFEFQPTDENPTIERNHLFQKMMEAVSKTKGAWSRAVTSSISTSDFGSPSTPLNQGIGSAAGSNQIGSNSVGSSSSEEGPMRYRTD
jgi:hypothetical protein